MAITKQEHEERKERVLREAFQLFVMHSIEAVSMQHIADAAKIGVASVFRYYENKTDLVIAVCSYKWKEYLERIEVNRPVEYIKNIPAIDRLEFTLDSYLDMYQHHKELLKFNDNFNHFITHENVDYMRLEKYLATVNPMRERMKWMYEKGQEDKTIRTDLPEEVFFRATAHSMMGACQHYAGGFIWGADKDKNYDYTQELLLLKDMIMKFARNDSN